MKIYGDYSFFSGMMGVRNQAQDQLPQGSMKLAEFADQYIEEHRAAAMDQMTVSEEGMDYIRKQLPDMGTGTKYETGDSSLVRIIYQAVSPTDKFYADHIRLHSDIVDEDGVSRNLYLDINSQYMKEMSGKENQDWKSHMEGLAKAYAAVRKKITEGYENGTREVWIRDDCSTGEDFNGIELETDGQTVRYRRLTKEEELNSLDKSIDRFTENAAAWYAKEEMNRAKEAEKEAQIEADKEANKDLEAFQTLVNNLVNEARSLLDRVREEIAKIEKMCQKETDIKGRMETEACNYRAETAARGKQQAQYANYRKMSQMVSDVTTLRGNLRA